MRPRVAIAGAGVAGLTCAAALAERAECIVFERLPMAGGEAWEDPRVAERVEAAKAAGMRFRGGTQVLRFSVGRLLAIGQHTTAERFAALVVATGHRPLTRAELQIDGPRSGGVLPATVAEHLMHRDVDLGRTVVVGDRSALPLVEQLLRQSDRGVALLLPDGASSGVPRSPVLEVYKGTRPISFVGSPRVRSVLAGPRDGQAHVRLDCDTVILAYGRVPYRNIEGAIFPADDVVFAQPGGGTRDGDETEAAGEAAAQAVLQRFQQPSEPNPLGGRT